MAVRVRHDRGEQALVKVVVAVVALVALVALLSVANWERESRADEQSEGMREVLERVGALDGPDLNGFRIFTNFECLVYERGRNDFALEVCVDDEGRIVETIDRIDGTPEVFSLRDDPTRSEVRVDRSVVDALLERMTT